MCILCFIVTRLFRQTLCGDVMARVGITCFLPPSPRRHQRFGARAATVEVVVDSVKKKKKKMCVGELKGFVCVFPQVQLKGAVQKYI